MSGFNYNKAFYSVARGMYKSHKHKLNKNERNIKMEELYKIEKGTNLYLKINGIYKKVEVYEIFLERYINGWKTIIKVKDGMLLLKYYTSDLNSVLFTKIPNDNLLEENK